MNVCNRLMNESVVFQSVEVGEKRMVGYTLLNGDSQDPRPAIVAVDGYMSDLTNSSSSPWINYQLAKSGRTVLALSQMGHGLSGSNDREQVTDLCLRRRLSAATQAEPLAEAVARILPAEQPVDYFGLSHGAFMVMLMAGMNSSNKAQSVLAIDLPAVRERMTLALQLKYMIKENYIGRKKFMDAISGSQQEAEFENFRDEFEDAKSRLAGHEDPKIFPLRSPGLFLLNMFRSVDATPAALDAWKSLVETDETVTVKAVTSVDGTVSDASSIENFIDSLTPEQQKRSSQLVVEGDHNICSVLNAEKMAEWFESNTN